MQTKVATTIAVVAALALLPPLAGGHVGGVLHAPGVWTLQNATVAPAPGGDGTAVRMDLAADGFGLASIELPLGLSLADIHTLSFDAYIDTGCFGGGSPGVQLGVDTNGDGVGDKNVHVYAGTAPGFTDCTTGAWFAQDLLDGALRFDSTQLGGPFYGTLAQANTAAGAGHQVVSATLVFDSGWLVGATVTWYDNIRVNCIALGEPADLVLSVVAANTGTC